MVSATKMSPQESGRLGARRRWGPEGRVIRLDALDPVTREIVVAILRARKNAAEAKAAAPPDPRAA
jgi:hypothetical protein